MVYNYFLSFGSLLTPAVYVSSLHVTVYSLKMAWFKPKHVAVIVFWRQSHVSRLNSGNLAHETQRFEPHWLFHMSFFYLGFILVAGRDGLCETAGSARLRSRAFRFSAWWRRGFACLILVPFNDVSKGLSLVEAEGTVRGKVKGVVNWGWWIHREEGLEHTSM